MFAPLPMQHVTLHLLKEDAPAAALTLAERASFNPEAAPAGEHDLPDRPGRHYQSLYRSARMRLDKALGHLDLDPYAVPRGAARVVSEKELAELDEWLGQVWHKCSQCEENLRRLEEETRNVEQLDRALDNYATLDINLGLLQGRLRFLDVRLGTVPISNVKRLNEALGLAGYYLTVFTVSEANAHVALAGLSGNEEEVRTVLEAANFRRIELPPEFRDYPEKVRADLARRRADVKEQRRAHEQEVAMNRTTYGDDLLRAAHALDLAAPYAQLADSLRSTGNLTVVSGWVPRDEVAPLREALVVRLGRRFVLEARDPIPAERPAVPSAVRYPAWLRGFASLVSNYGVPRYGEFDPTWLFALTFVAMFGMMFGDVGHGLTIAGVALWQRRRLQRFTPFVVALGVSSTVFGFLYGSLFGYEEAIHPLWMSPLSDPSLMLTLALYWGVGFILLSTAITIRNRLAERRYQEALLDGRGLAGLLLYLGLLFSVVSWVAAGEHGLLHQAAIFVPLAVILVYHWRKTEAHLGERLLVVFIEGFETLMSYISNTLSFLRVAAFSLNHVALALAVFTIAGMLGTTGHWITVILGNLFILVLEGAIVAIQVLRLEYYEGFSRFFSGDGREFRPLTLNVAR
jgi:V/A-type H+-transporting ATPase subunit I